VQAGTEGTLVRLDVAGGVATITLDSPRNRNALSCALVSQLADSIDAAAAHSLARVIVLTGAGPVFCSGADLKEQREAAAEGKSVAPPLPEVVKKLWACPQPVVCRLNGLARAGGIGLLAACDFVVAPDNVTFSFTEVRLGVVPAMISVPMLRRVAAQTVHRLFLTAEVFDAGYARDIGLVDEFAAEGDVDAAVGRVVEMLMRGAPQALALTKQLTRTVGSLSIDAAFERMTQLSAERFGSAEGQEGIRAFAEKRDPEWLPAAYRNT
jgi:methylglutaconyl-CoA hydratase